MMGHTSRRKSKRHQNYELECLLLTDNQVSYGLGQFLQKEFGPKTCKGILSYYLKHHVNACTETVIEFR